MKIIHFNESQHGEEVRSWWKKLNEVSATKEMMPEESSFVLLAPNDKPWMFITVYLLNIKEFAIVENCVSNPSLPGGEARKLAGEYLNRFLDIWVKEKGYKKIFCLAPNDGLAKRYKELGYTQTLDNVKTFIKELK